MNEPPNPTANEPRASRAERSKSTAPERPRFLETFPEHEELSRAATAFENGDYAQVRNLCRQLLEHERDPEVRAAANELLHRIEPDRLIVATLWASFVLLALVVLWAYGHGR